MPRRQIRIADLFNLIDPGAEREVDRTRKTFNRSIRDMLRHDMALVLEAGSDPENARASDRGGRISVPVRVLPGMPTEVEQLDLGDAEELEVALQGCKVTLEETRLAVARMPAVVDALRGTSSGGDLARVGDLAIQQMNSFLTRTLSVAGAIDPVARVLAVDQDVLGSYGLDTQSKKPVWVSDEDDTRVALYWAVIALVALHQGVPVATLTVIVLAHELAHAYTHRGSDIEGYDWDREGFFRSERSVIEGLAQYYTARACRQLETRVRGITDAFDRLATFQSAPYRVHQGWLERSSPEAVRYAMVAVRRRGVCSLADFESALASAQGQLPRQRKRSDTSRSLECDGF